MHETWEDIKGYEGSYQISNFGRVKSLERIIHYKDKVRGDCQRIQNERIMAEGIKKDDYRTISLYKKNKGTTFHIHRLVAIAFIPNPLDKEVVNHIDFDKSNNKVNNLEWATQQENIGHSYDEGRYFNNVYEEVKAIYENGVVETYPSIVTASKNIGCHRDTIYGYWERGYSPKLEELGIIDIVRLS